ncbi:stress-induced protein [Listeria monocytogenes]|uniref:stress-induced protein n=1 Tax=Listeria monocytogenes TaxID=1639 RepID=UPI000D657B1F|nr:stress-induced protein [Listeria monocytogenes]PWG36758.1 stress-induced protein [Listeria monocytogenes]
MANEQNLIKNSERTPSERRENAKKAGVASGKARRKKANLKKAFETILQADVASPSVKKQLEDMGFDTTNEMALAMVMMQKAMKGNVRAFEQISKLTTTDAKDSLDKKEQKERIEALKLGNEKLRKQIGTSDIDVKDDGFIKSLEGVVEETWQD